MLKIIEKSKNKKHKTFFFDFPSKNMICYLKKEIIIIFFQYLKKNFNIIDFTEIFEKYDIDKIYLPDQYGAHLSAYGNKIVANTLSEKLN